MSKPKEMPILSDTELLHLAARFKLLGEPMRLKILQSVCHQARTVGDIVAAAGSTQANVSKHLALLTTSGVLDRRKAGQFVYYGIRDKLVMRLCNLARTKLAE